MREKYRWLNLTTGSAPRHAFLVLIFYSLLFTLFFSPVLFYDSYLAPADALLYHLTYFQSEKTFWDPLLSVGFPMTYDPQVMSWYPPSMLFSLLPGGWNLFVLSAYVMAGSFTYGYVYALTESRVASFVAGTVYSMCGFMMAHLGHTAIIHAAAWPPLIVWSLEMLRSKLSARWLAIACLAVGCSILAGHLQIVVYGLLMAGFYAIVSGWTAPVGRMRYYTAAGFVFVVGLGLAALQLLPAAELARASTRTEYSYADFVSYSLPLKQAFMLLYPAALGGLRRYGTTPYSGAWNLTELTGYIGLIAPVLAAVGFIVSRRSLVSIFWLCVGLMAFLLALGSETPLAYLISGLPVISKFRAPARHLFELAFAFAVLAGLGVRAVLQREVTKRLMLIAVGVAALLMTTGFIALRSVGFSQEAQVEGGAHLNIVPWSNPAVGVPILIFLAATAILLYWHREPASLHRRSLLLLILIVDLASFGWFYEWREISPRKDILNPPAAISAYKNLLGESHQRMLSVRGVSATPDELRPNLSRVWGVPNATGYGPLIPSRTLYFLSILPDASVASSWKSADDQSLSLAAVRYVLLPVSEAAKDSGGVSWHEENMGLWLGRGCDHPQRDAVHFDLPAPRMATSLHLVTRLACAVPLKDGEEAARVLLTDVDGNTQSKSLLAGRDSSEWSYDCPNIRPQVQHGRAEIFSSFAASMYDEPCEGHFYSTKLMVDNARPIRSLEIRWMGREGAITIEKISLLDESTKSSEAVSPMSIEGSPWRFVAEEGRARVFENMRSRPRAWLVSEVLRLRPEDILSAIKTSRLPDGRRFDPADMALVEEPFSLSSQGIDREASVQITHLSNTSMELQTTSPAQSFLVTSDVYYPGWRVMIDGNEARLLRVDYALRGVQVPAGRHVVRFEFRPKVFYYGAALSLLSLIALAGVLALSRFNGKFARLIYRGSARA
jgi:hypothetical protein